jgi:PAS domain S-box-containing protein
MSPTGEGFKCAREDYMTGKLLIVDDSATDRLIIKNMLTDYDVMTTSGGLEALRLIEAHEDIDLIILDLNMPGMDGFGVLEALKSMDRGKQIRTIILTNYDEMDKEIRGLQSGAVDFIRKPVNMESLRVRIGIHLELLRIQRLYEQTLYERSLTLDTLLDQAPIGIAMSHGELPGSSVEDQTIFNAAYERITGRTREELIALGWGQITHPDDIAREMELYRRFQAGEIKGYSMEKRFIRPDGSIVWVDVLLAPLKRRSDIKYNHLCLIQDITERKAVESALSESERSKSVLLANLPGMAYRCDNNHEWTMRFVSEGCYDLTGYHAESLLDNRDLSFNDLIAPEYQQSLWAEWQRVLASRLPFKSEYEIMTASGQRKWVLEMGQGVFGQSGNVEALEGIIIDITDRKIQEMKLKHISEIDSLTGLYNRRYLENILASEAAASEEGARAIVLLSLRKINTISLTYGYSFSEKIVTELTEGLSGLVNENRDLFQISFERFAFYCRRYGSADELKDFCQSIMKLVDGMQILRTAGCGIGVYEFDCRGCEAENVIRNASAAAERADESQVLGYRFFDRDMDIAVKREAEVKEALIRLVNESPCEHLYLQYQPVLNLKTNRVEGFEALARFKSEKLGMVSPVEFIPIAEETQLIVPIGRSVLEMAGAFQKRLQALGYGHVRTFVNVSAIQLLRGEYVADFLSVLKKYGVAPENFGMEITESVFVDNYLAINKKLEQLMELGVEISIDDFGTGYSSLARERELKVNCLKIDKSFIDRLMILRPEFAITGDIISMAHKMGHTVVAEGVEYQKQKQYLLDHDCDLLQGYLFSRPLDEDSAIELLAGQN